MAPLSVSKFSGEAKGGLGGPKLECQEDHDRPFAQRSDGGPCPLYSAIVGLSDEVDAHNSRTLRDRRWGLRKTSAIKCAYPFCKAKEAAEGGCAPG